MFRGMRFSHLLCNVLECVEIDLAGHETVKHQQLCGLRETCWGSPVRPMPASLSRMDVYPVLVCVNSVCAGCLSLPLSLPLSLSLSLLSLQV